MQRLDNKEEIFKRLELLSQYPQIATVIDLIYGFPMQTESVWENDVAQPQRCLWTALTATN